MLVEVMSAPAARYASSSSATTAGRVKHKRSVFPRSGRG